MSKISLKELSKLIKDCKNSGVSSLKYGDIEISIGVPSQGPMTPVPRARVSAKKAQEITDKALLQTQFDEASLIVETLQAEDPVLYEQMLIEGELGEAKND